MINSWRSLFSGGRVILGGYRSTYMEAEILAQLKIYYITSVWEARLPQLLGLGSRFTRFSNRSGCLKLRPLGLHNLAGQVSFANIGDFFFNFNGMVQYVSNPCRQRVQQFPVPEPLHHYPLLHL